MFPHVSLSIFVATTTMNRHSVMFGFSGYSATVCQCTSEMTGDKHLVQCVREFLEICVSVTCEMKGDKHVWFSECVRVTSD